MIIGHGIRGNRQGDRILEVCPTSNVVTGQVASFKDHPIDRLYREGRKVTVNTDGTLFTRVDLTGEYLSLSRHFGWRTEDFYQVNRTALEATNLPDPQKSRLLARLHQSYMG
jgi:adenosine deaminase